MSEEKDVFTRDQKFGGVGEDIKPVDNPEEADDKQFKGFEEGVEHKDEL